AGRPGRRPGHRDGHRHRRGPRRGRAAGARFLTLVGEPGDLGSGQSAVPMVWDGHAEKGDPMSGIVVGSDGSDVSRHAVEWAAREAQLLNEPLRVVHVLQRWLFEMPETGPHAEVGRWAREDARNVVETAARQA